MSMTFRPASRSSAKPLIGIYAESGAGKTWSALMLARGFVGPEGTIGMIETESGRGEAYEDLLPGGYQVLSLRDSFSPENYGAAIAAAEKANLGALIIDSASHEWEGIGGVLDMADKNKAAGKKALLVWQKPKMDHAKHFMLKLMQTSIPLVIICMRAKYSMEEGRDHRGNKTFVRSKDLSPKQDDNILYELFVHGWVDHDHRWHGTKYTRPDLREVLVDNQCIDYDTGKRLAAWASGHNHKAATDIVGDIRAATTADELKAIGATIPNLGLEGVELEDARETYKQKLRALTEMG